MNESHPDIPIGSIAIVGMAGRFPGARNVREFWENIRTGVESITRFKAEEMEVPDARALMADPGYVAARPILEDVDLFDAGFFGIYPKEAELLDPQHRVFLECCWEALEDAGYDPQTYPGAIGVFAGCSASTYFLRRLRHDPDFIERYTCDYQIGNYPTMMGANADFLSTRVSYKLNLRGPSFTMQAGCSTSLLTVCQACESLLHYQSDMALAGGVSITFPQKRGYAYQEGSMGSPDGHCRTFDAKAQGTVFGSGAGVVLLKRLEDAVATNDHIYAVIRGCAVNNDGSAKVGYTAPSIEGQAQVIAAALAAAGVGPESIGYIEAHGTATPLGDPIEVAALTRAFRARTQARNFCTLGTAKMNVGHLDIAAGVTGLINAVNVLRHRSLPPSIHFERPNPNLDLENSPFFVNTQFTEWKNGAGPRQAGVSAFGVGGTNAHVILEEAPATPRVANSRPGHLLLLSARSETALDTATNNLTERLKEGGLDLSDVAYTLQTGRRSFDHRRMLVCRDATDAMAALESGNRNRLVTRTVAGEEPQVAFLFPGQGAQYPGMGLELYRTESKFRAAVDTCAEILVPLAGFDLRSLLYPGDAQTDQARQQLNNTVVTQPAIFVIEYALAQLWMEWGIQPRAMIGHSIGEFVAATLAGVFSLEDALALIAARARLMQDLPGGSMLAVRLAEEDLRPLLGDLDVAAINSPTLTVAAGPDHAVGKLEETLQQKGVMSRRLSTSHAFHSRMMEPIVQPFLERVKQVTLNAPRIPYLSGVTGKWVTAADVTDPVYWVRHFRDAVRFSEGIQELRMSERILLEVGPGNTLNTLARQHATSSAGQIIVSSLADASSGLPDYLSVLTALGWLWLGGAQPDWNAVHGEARPQRCSLPTYPFERQRYWIDAGKTATTASTTAPEKTMPEAQTIATPARLPKIKSMVTSIFEELSGMKLEGGDPSTTFLEMGFDSLFLTQVTQALQSKFGLKVTFRQLLDQEATFEALAAYLDARLPADKFAEPVQSAAPASPVSPASVSGMPVSLPALPEVAAVAAAPAVPAGAMEAIFKEQIQAMSQLMARQLEALRGAGATAQAAVSAAASVTTPAMAAPAPAKSTEDKQEFKPFGPYKPVQKGPAGGLTARQAEYLNALIRRYTARTKESKRLTQAHRRTLADPRVVSGFRAQWKEMVYPIITVRSQGSRLWDVDGNEYIDILNGFGPIMFGHAPRFVTEAVEQQLRDGFEIGPQTALAGKVADLVCELTGMERATFCNTGSEAVMAAMRVARTVTGRKKIVLFAGAYHGTFDEVLVKGITRAGVPHSMPIAPGIPEEKVENVIVLEYGTKESLEVIRARADELAAVLVEPVQSRHPALQPREFLQEIRRITTQSGTALIIDEVVTGFRVHPGGAQAVFGVQADLATYGKVIGGGLPIGILAGKAAFMDALDGGMWNYGDDSFPEVGVTFFAGTFVRHPLAMAAVHAVLKHLKASGPELQQCLNENTARLVRTLNEFFEERAVPTRIEHFGSIFYFSFPTEHRLASLFYYHLREKGIHILEGFPCFLTTAHTNEDIERIIRAFRESILEMQEAGALPESSRVPAREPVPVTVNAASEVIPTEAQKEIWLAAQLGDDASCAFNESFTVRMKGRLDEAALRSSIQEVVNRHEGLRATFSPAGDQLRFKPSLNIDVPEIDMSSVAPEHRAGRMEEIIREDARSPFDLVNGPLVRAMLVKLDDENHSLVFTAHHIVCDGWSTNVLLDELSRLYSAKCLGVGCELPPPMPFSKYAQAQAEQLGSADYAEVENWWAAKFSTGAPVLELPTDRPRPAGKSFQGATCRRIIDAAAARRIKRAGAQQGCTMFATMLAGFHTLLQRLSGQNDIVVGIPTAGQSLVDGDTLVGHCVNFLPVRAAFDPGTAAAKFLRQIKADLLDAYEHQNYTYGSLVRKLALPRDPSRLPLIEVQFNLEKVGAGIHFDGLKVEVDPNPKSFVNFDLFLNVVESDTELVLDCDYNSYLFDEVTISGWLGHYQTLLEAMATDASIPLSKMPVLSAAERSQQIVQWNDTNAEFPRHKCIHELFEEQATRTPGATAVVVGEARLTYAELNTRSNQLAGYLSQLGVGPETLVGIYVDRSLDMMVGLLGVLKAGGVYLPLDPSYPKERLSFILQDAGIALLLTQERLAVGLGTIEARVLCLDKDWNLIAAGRRLPAEGAAKPENLAYVIYTSGSTGKPKGVAIPHRAMVNLLCSMQRQPGITEKDTLVAVTTLSFDIAALELFLPVISGARLVIAPREVAIDGAELSKLLVASGATVFQATPGTFGLLLEAGWKGSPQLKMLCGGEALPRDLANALQGCGASLWNMYGPTETTIWSSTMRIGPGDGAVPVGPPIANTQFYVLDAAGEPVPLGVAGELHIGGEGVARSYWNRPELTAEKFIEDPFRNEAGARLYKTGDLVRYRPDGTLDFLGRMDNQVKVRGFRIELGEVESALSGYPGIQQCVAVAREDTPGDKRLVAYVVAGPPPAAAADLRSFLAARLPDYMVPSVFVPLDELPRTPNGKVDRRNLSAPDVAGLQRPKSFVPPANQRERELAEICAQVLYLDRVSVDDNLFELGADSIHLFQISARAGNAGIKVTPRQILQHRTISALFAALENNHGEEPRPQDPQIVAVGRRHRMTARSIG
jgi:glutamate-1-semialdehyde-2,1-aminomutase